MAGAETLNNRTIDVFPSVISNNLLICMPAIKQVPFSEESTATKLICQLYNQPQQLGTDTKDNLPFFVISQVGVIISGTRHRNCTHTPVDGYD